MFHSDPKYRHRLFDKTDYGQVTYDLFTSASVKAHAKLDERLAGRDFILRRLLDRGYCCDRIHRSPAAPRRRRRLRLSPTFAAWYQRVRNRPAVQRGIAVGEEAPFEPARLLRGSALRRSLERLGAPSRPDTWPHQPRVSISCAPFVRCGDRDAEGAASETRRRATCAGRRVHVELRVELDRLLLGSVVLEIHPVPQDVVDRHALGTAPEAGPRNAARNSFRRSPGRSARGSRHRRPGASSPKRADTRRRAASRRTRSRRRRTFGLACTHFRAAWA